jgi:DnaK suppressor protein
MVPAMGEELSPEQMRELTNDLRGLEKQLRAAMEMSKDGAKPVDLDEPIGRVSRMDAIQQQSMIASNRAASRARLGRVGEALAAIERGEYGACARCEEPIAFRRLKAKPESRLCVACQGASERAR